jgi:hypothetical protein
MKKLLRVIRALMVLLFMIPSIAPRSLIGTVLAQSCSDNCVYEYLFSSYEVIPQCMANCGATICVNTWDFYQDSCSDDGYWDGPYRAFCSDTYYFFMQCCHYL